MFIIPIVLSNLVPSLSISKLTRLIYADQNGKPQILKICEEISCKWEKVGDLLGLTTERLKGISMQPYGGPKMFCRDVLLDWLHDNQGFYPTTWEGVVALLEDIDCTSVTAILKKNFNISGQHSSSKLLEHGMLCLHVVLR